MSIIQSSPVEIAARTQNRLFALYVVVLVVGGLAAAFLTVLVYRANNTYQQNVKTDADARIAEAGTSAAKAGERSAIANAEAAKANAGLAKSNEEIARLTKEAEQAKTERAEADTQIAIAKADALRAREGIANAEAVSAKAGVEVARLQVVVANAEKRRAEAEKSLLELQERIKPRHLTAAQRSKLLEILKGGPKGKVTFEIFVGDKEAGDFLDEIALALRDAGWTVIDGSQNTVSPPRGVGIFVHSKDAPPFAGFLQNALKAIGLDAAAQVADRVPQDTVMLYVGPKP